MANAEDEKGFERVLGKGEKLDEKRNKIKVSHNYRFLIIDDSFVILRP